MRKQGAYPPPPGKHLKSMVQGASFGGLFLSLIGTLIVWAGGDTFNCPALVWKASLTLNLILFALAWLLYFPFRKTDKLLGHGLLSLIMLFACFWLFGFLMLYFYFLFAPLNTYVRLIMFVRQNSAVHAESNLSEWLSY
jgi:hypothetical protein